MPTSNLALAPLALSYLQDALTGSPQPTVLDVGPGHGKYGVLITEYLDPTPTVDAVEAWLPYIHQFRLAGIYRHVYASDVLDLPPATLNAYDCLFLGDVLEHLDKQAALDLIARTTTHLVIVTPEHFFHNGDNLPWTETHRSHWTLDDFHHTRRLLRGETHLGGVIAHLGPG